MDIALHISTPPVAPVTLFHPDAYLPAFIGKVEERGSRYDLLAQHVKQKS